MDVDLTQSASLCLLVRAFPLVAAGPAHTGQCLLSKGTDNKEAVLMTQPCVAVTLCPCRCAMC